MASASMNHFDLFAPVPGHRDQDARLSAFAADRDDVSGVPDAVNVLRFYFYLSGSILWREEPSIKYYNGRARKVRFFAAKCSTGMHVIGYRSQ